MEDYLKEHRDEYTRAGVIQAQQILLTLPPKATDAQRRQAAQKAQELLGKARAGEDFADLARANSQDAATREQGGELGLVRRGQHPPEWDKVAFALKPGTMGLAATDKGIYLIKLEEIKETELLPDAAKQVEYASQRGAGPATGQRRGPAGPGGVVPGFPGPGGKKIGGDAPGDPALRPIRSRSGSGDAGPLQPGRSEP